MVRKLKKSPLAPERFPKLAPLAGVELFAIASGSRYQGRDDLLVMHFDVETKTAGVFTKSSMPAIPIDISRENLAQSNGCIRALVVNAGIANAFTGMRGVRAARKIMNTVACLIDCTPHQVLMASTGIIGADLEPAPICEALEQTLKKSKTEINRAGGKTEPQNWEAAARAIMTTDTFPKAATQRVAFGTQHATIHVIAKGSGMIAPDMATMLCFMVTDAAIPTRILQELISTANIVSLNAVSVDGDMSTSDMFLGFATAKMRLPRLRRASDPRLIPFREGLTAALQDIAQQIAADGEGAQKLITVDVTGAANDVEAHHIARAIVTSPLVKTAVAGADPNWGRIVMAIGKSGARAMRDRLKISIGGYLVARSGRPVTNYRKEPIAEHMRGQHVVIAVDVGALDGKGRGCARVWGCDLTHAYVTINADYRN